MSKKTDVDKYFDDKVELILQLKQLKELSINEIKTITRCPNFLYKYRDFDEHTFDMIENQYIYLAEPKKLDDQFECKVNELDTSLKRLSDEELHKILDYAIIKKIVDLLPKQNQFLMKEVEKSCFEADAFSREKYIMFFMKKNKKSSKEIQEVISKSDVLANKLLENEEFKNVIHTLLKLLNDLRTDTGICSLAEKKDNQVMWTMYANHYKGCCIEYDFSSELDNPNYLGCCYKLYPVLYKKKRDFNIVGFLTAIIMNAFLEEKIQKKNYPSFLKEFLSIILTKGKDWEFQREWRLIDSCKTKHPAPKIKAIYLGSNVKEANKQKILDYAEKYDFKVYIQENDYQTLELKFTELKKEKICKNE